MKKIAVISDFHGNNHALVAVIREAQKSGCDEYLCCGDYVGYYYEFDKVIDLIRTLPHVAILGNHDRDFLRLLDGEWQITDEYRKEYGSSLEIAKDNMERRNILWLRSLPSIVEVSIENKRILLCHGSPWDVDEYLYPDMDNKKLDQIYALSYDLVIVGHSHYQYLKNRDRQLLLNPGSVGQPRDRGGAAAWAMVMIKSDTIDVKLLRTNYDVKDVISQVKRIDPQAKYLYEVLVRGLHGI